ncbi:hypothetical protein NGRA_2021 [Nosema granulosis]|uniref:Uncharacterized protein n=1 Tax=Nosema granulosis TaxID=83296 RepID=A0A9P6KY34_9MICR|nr:hypothetical protein NGRA_2021 [Nosema granulosis]
MAKKYGFTRSTKVRTHSVQEVMTNDNAEIRVDTRVDTDAKVAHNKPDILIVDKMRKEIIIIEVGITNFDLLSVVENEKLRNYDLLANELGLIHKCMTKIILYVMTNFHKKYLKELDVLPT